MSSRRRERVSRIGDSIGHSLRSTISNRLDNAPPMRMSTKNGKKNIRYARSRNQDVDADAGQVEGLLPFNEAQTVDALVLGGHLICMGEMVYVVVVGVRYAAVVVQMPSASLPLGWLPRGGLLLVSRAALGFAWETDSPTPTGRTLGCHAGQQRSIRDHEAPILRLRL